MISSLPCGHAVGVLMLRRRTKAKEMERNFPYNLHPIDKYQKQAEYDNGQGGPKCLHINALLQAKSHLSLTRARPPGSSMSSLTSKNPSGNFLELYTPPPNLKVFNELLLTIPVQPFLPTILSPSPTPVL